MQSNETRKRALVLGGGGVAGVAWELGILTGFYDRGMDVRDADLFIGTSAGSVVGAQITSGTDLESLFASQLTPLEQTKERKVEFDPMQMMEAFRQAADTETGEEFIMDRTRVSLWLTPSPPVAPFPVSGRLLASQDIVIWMVVYVRRPMQTWHMAMIAS
jgi:Patatin-like phospholipase